MDSNKWKVKDCGDVDYIPGDPKGTCENLEEAVRILIRKGGLPVILGGDCSVVYPVVKGLEEKGLLDIIHFDAHLDWTKPMDGQKYFNGSPMRNAAELTHVGRILHLGIEELVVVDQMILLQLKLMGIRCIPSECLEEWE